MILKIKNIDGTWNYYEGDSINQHIIDDDMYPVDAIRIIGKKDVPIIKSFYIEKDRKIINRMVTNRPTYLLNDNGKTIDKLS